MNGAIWQAIKSLARNDPEWKRTCGTLHRGKPKREMPGPHVIWYDNIGGEESDAFGADIGTVLSQFTLVSASADSTKIDAMCRATRSLFHTARLTTADMLVGHMHVSRAPRVTMEDGTYDATMDATITYQGATQVPAFPGRG